MRYYEGIEYTDKEYLGFNYRVEGHRQANGLHRGWIFLFNRGSGEVAYNPPVIIETPTAFKSAHAAAIEASVYIRELITNGTIYKIVPPGERRSIPRFQKDAA